MKSFIVIVLVLCVFGVRGQVVDDWKFQTTRCFDDNNSPNIFSCYPNLFVDEINIYVNIQKMI